MSLKSLIAAIFGLKTEDEYNHLKDTNTKLMTEVTQCEAENKELQTKLQTTLDKYDTLTATHNAEIAEAKQTISDNEAKIKSLNNTVVDLNATISQKNDQIALLTATVNELKKEIESLKQEIQDLKKQEEDPKSKVSLTVEPQEGVTFTANGVPISGTTYYDKGTKLLLTCYKDNKKTKSFYISEAADEDDSTAKATKDKK